MPLPARLTLLEYAALAFIVVVWGINNAAAKLATEVLPPMLMGALRFGLAAVVLAPFVRPPFPNWKSLLTLALVGGPIHFGLIYWGFSRAEDLTPLAVSLQLWIPFTAIFAWLVLGEKLSKPILAGLIVAFAGVVFMTADPRAFRDWDAIVICAVASAAWALATVIARRTQAVAPIKMQGLIALVAFPVLAVGSALFEPDPIGAMQRATPLIWASVVFAALISTVVATGLLFWLVQRREAGRVTAYLLVTPVVSGIIGVAFMGDVVDAQILIGAAACISGVGLVALAERWPRKTVAIESLGES
jgi:O-acetylserine/cysteine efflux transporter